MSLPIPVLFPLRWSLLDLAMPLFALVALPPETHSSSSRRELREPATKLGFVRSRSIGEGVDEAGVEFVGDFFNVVV